MNSLHVVIEKYLDTQDQITCRSLCRDLYSKLISRESEFESCVVSGNRFRISNYICTYKHKCGKVIGRLKELFDITIRIDSLMKLLYCDIAIISCGLGGSMYEEFRHLIWERPEMLLINGIKYACKYQKEQIIKELTDEAIRICGGKLTSVLIGKIFTYRYAYNLDFREFAEEHGCVIYPLELASCSGTNLCKLYKQDTRIHKDLVYIVAIAAKDGWLDKLAELETPLPTQEEWNSLSYVSENNKQACRILQSLDTNKIKFLRDNWNLPLDVLDYHRDNEERVVSLPLAIISGMIDDHLESHGHECMCLDRMIRSVRRL